MIQSKGPSGRIYRHRADYSGEAQLIVRDLEREAGPDGTLYVVGVPFEDMRFLVREADELHKLLGDASLGDMARASFRAVRRRIRERRRH